MTRKLLQNYQSFRNNSEYQMVFRTQTPYIFCGRHTLLVTKWMSLWKSQKDWTNQALFIERFWNISLLLSDVKGLLGFGNIIFGFGELDLSQRNKQNREVSSLAVELCSEGKFILFFSLIGLKWPKKDILKNHSRQKNR